MALQKSFSVTSTVILLKPTWQGECKAIALPIDCMSQQWQALGYVPCFALAAAYNRLPHVWRGIG